MPSITRLWLKRDFTLYGKATIIKSFVTYQLVLVQPSPSSSTMLFHLQGNIQTNFQVFVEYQSLWNKKELISRKGTGKG